MEKELRLDFCEKCFQMTNHLNDECQKCKAKENNNSRYDINFKENDDKDIRKY